MLHELPFQCSIRVFVSRQPVPTAQMSEGESASRAWRRLPPYSTFPSVYNVTLAEEQLDLISKLQNFVSTYTTALWIALMFASGLLIWNTIRTAMFARRREIEVMKLVGATDWFIRIPFMLEGLIQGLLGGIFAVGAMLFINWRWTNGVRGFPESSGMTALVVIDGYQWTVAIVILVFGALVGMIGSGIAASRFLDV